MKIVSGIHLHSKSLRGHLQVFFDQACKFEGLFYAVVQKIVEPYDLFLINLKFGLVCEVSGDVSLQQFLQMIIC